jgi:hypothetical protein
MAKATTYANDVLDQTLPNGASGTVTIGATTYTLPFRVIFLSTLSTAAAQGTEWATAAGYVNSGVAGGATGGVALNGLVATAASAASKANTGAITVTNAPAGTWADNEVHDSTATTQKRVVFKGTPSLGKTVNLGDTCSIGIGSLTATEA